jgi:hypothetical protein
LNFPVSSMNGSFKPNLQHFQFCLCVRYSVLPIEQCYKCNLMGIKSRHVYIIKDVIFSILWDIEARHHYCERMRFVLLVLNDIFIVFYSSRTVPVFLTWILFNESPIGGACFFLSIFFTSYMLYASFIASDPLLKFN